VAWISSIDALGGVWRLLDLAVPVLALFGLGRLLAALPRPATGEHQQSLATGTADAEAPAQLEAAPDPANEPTWQPDQAAGAAWLTAGDAAAGAAATGWGTPGETTGWEPRPSDPAPRDPLDQTEWERDQPPRS
jgi:hypothetical protein